MSFLSSQSSPQDDDNNEADAHAKAHAAPETATDTQKALILAALGDVDTASVRLALANPVPQIVIISTPSHHWSRALADEIGQVYDNISVFAVSDRKADGNLWLFNGVAKRIDAGQHQVFCTADPDTMLPAALHSASDVHLALPAVTAKLIQRAIRGLCGSAARGLTDGDVAGLDFPDLQIALRPGSTARECLVRLRQAATAAVAQSTLVGDLGPALDDLPLPAELAGWAYDLVEQLQEVAAGTMAPDVLRHGVLSGEPGTGKTMVAGAIARSAGWSFQPTSIGAWFNSSDGNLGGMSKTCVGFFDTLLSGDCVVGFLDELDSLPSRASLEPRDRQWWSTLINLMLTQIDRLRSSGKRVLLLSATNYAERLDPALVRAGRLEQQVIVRIPQTEAEIMAIFAHYLKDEINPAELASIAPFAHGVTPATIAGWIRAARATARSKQRPIAAEDVFSAVVPLDDRADEELYAVAIHEAGHTVVALALGIDVESVSIISRGSTGGVTRTAPISSFPNRRELEDMVTVLLGGRAADVVCGGKGAHAGAGNDLEMATSFLARAHCQLGLYETLGRQTGPTPKQLIDIDEALKRLLDHAVVLITKNSTAVTALARALMRHRLLSGSKLAAVIQATAGTGTFPADSLPKDEKAAKFYQAEKPKGPSHAPLA